MDMHQHVMIEAEPYPFELIPVQCALLIIDMQRDFLEAGGFGEMLGNDVSQLRRTIEPNRKLLTAWRAAGLPVMHTREVTCRQPKKSAAAARPASETLGLWAVSWCGVNLGMTLFPNSIP